MAGFRRGMRPKNKSEAEEIFNKIPQEELRCFTEHITAIVLWTLHDEFRFGSRRLQRFERRYFWLLRLFIENHDPEVAKQCRKELEQIGVSPEDPIGGKDI